MMAFVVRVRLPHRSLHAVHIVRLTAFDLHLDGRMRDAEMTCQLFRDTPEHVSPLAHTLLIDHDMTAATPHAGTDGPHVQVMHRQYSVYAADCPLDRGHIHA